MSDLSAWDFPTIVKTPAKPRTQRKPMEKVSFELIVECRRAYEAKETTIKDLAAKHDLNYNWLVQVLNYQQRVWK